MNSEKPGEKTRPSMFAKRPAGMLLLGLRLPICLYHLHLGWVLGDRFLLLAHTGRNSGRTRTTVLEVVKHDRTSNAFFVVSGWGHKSDWYQNVHKNPEVFIRSGGQSLQARAEGVLLAESIDILEEYSHRYAIAFKELTALFLGDRMEPGREAAKRLAEKMPMVVFRPRP
jgi:deazaflavin-dependent oxidoreductase (nitroreductase family)